MELLALPTLPIFPPRLDELEGDLTDLVVEITRYTSLFNAAGVPCTAQPVPVTGLALPASLQLVGPLGGEEHPLLMAQRIESAVAESRRSPETRWSDDVSTGEARLGRTTIRGREEDLEIRPAQLTFLRWRGGHLVVDEGRSG